MLSDASGEVSSPEAVHLLAITSHLRAPTAVAIGPAGKVYVTESSQDRLQVFAADGRYSGTLEGLDRPLSVAVDGRGRIYVGNAGRRSVEVYGQDLRLLGSLGEGEGEVGHPSGIAVDGRGRVFVVDRDAKSVRVYGPEWSLERTVKGTVEGAGRLGIPVAAAVDEASGELIVTDVGNISGSIEKYDARILVFDAGSGTFKREFGAYGVGEGLLIKPLGVAADGRGRLFVTDAFQNVVHVLDGSGAFLTVVHDEENPLRTPLGVAYDGSRGRLFVASLARARVEVYGVAAPQDMRSLSVSISGSGTGMVTIEPGGDACSDSCSYAIRGGAEVSLSAEASDGSVFSGWEGGCSGTGVCRIVIEGDMAVEARFSEIREAGGAPRDFNGDGASDVLGWNENSGRLCAWMGSESHPADPHELGVTGPQLVVEGAGDFNGDRAAEILLRNSRTGNVFLWGVDVAGETVTAVTEIDGPATRNWEVAGIADFDGNGLHDVLWRHLHSGQLLLWLFADLDRVVEVRVNAGGMKEWAVAAVGDFEGDGSADILWRRDRDGAVALWPMAGGAVKDEILLAPESDPAWRIAGASDFDRDGCADILWHCPEDGSLHLWLMNGAAVESSLPAGNLPSPEWSVIGCGDFNGDGYADLHGVHGPSGEIRVWLLEDSRVGGSRVMGFIAGGMVAW